MNPDRFVEEQAIKASAPKVAAPRKVSPYTRARGAASAGIVSPRLGDPVPDPSIGLSETQPSFPPEMAVLPPMPNNPEISAPVIYPGSDMWGMEDKRKLDQAQTTGSQIQKDVYQNPEDFLRHQGEVMASPAIAGLMQGANSEQELAKNFLEAYPKGVTDESSVMGLADYLAKGRGNALASYRKPMSYADITNTVSGLLSKAQMARQQAAQLGMMEAGPLKSGTMGVNQKQEEAASRGTGYQVPHPPIMNPFQILQGVGHSYESNPQVKAINDEVKAANDAVIALQNPSWLSDTTLRGRIIQSMGVNRITETELTTLGGGSPGLMNQANLALAKLTSGHTLSVSDRHTIEEYSNARLRAALALRDQVHQHFQNTYGGFLPESSIGSVTSQGDIQPIAKPQAADQSDKNAKAFADSLMNMIRGAK